MPPKKDAAGAEAKELLVGFTEKETKLIAAAFLSSTGPDKFDYDLMSTITGNTAGSLKKIWPPVKRKAMEKHPSFAKFLGQSSANGSEAPKSSAGPKSRKRKTHDDIDEDDVESEVQDSESEKKSLKKTNKPMAEKKGRGRPKKQLKTEDSDAEEHASDNGKSHFSEAEQSV